MFEYGVRAAAYALNLENVRCVPHKHLKNNDQDGVGNTQHGVECRPLGVVEPRKA